VSTSGKYVVGKLRDVGFSIHLADPSMISLIFNTGKKNDKEDSYKLAKLLRLGELPEFHLHSKFSDAIRSFLRYRKNISKEMNMLKNGIHEVLTGQGIAIHATDIFGRRGIRSILGESSNFPDFNKIVLSDLKEKIS